jgi:hypothetical protein
MQADFAAFDEFEIVFTALASAPGFEAVAGG